MRVGLGAGGIEGVGMRDTGDGGRGAMPLRGGALLFSEQCLSGVGWWLNHSNFK